MGNLVTYVIHNMRVTQPTGKVATDNPERVFTVAGTFHKSTVDAKGNLVAGDKLTFASKNVDREDALAEGFVIDPVNGILTLPEGQRGRTAREGLSVDAIDAALSALRTSSEDADSAS